MDTWLNPDCKICGGSGAVYPRVNGKLDYTRLVSCVCTKERNIQQARRVLLDYCGLPPIVENMTMQNFNIYKEVQTAYDTAKKIAKNPNELVWVTFMGGNDTGKTHLAISICRAWIEKCIPAKYVYVPILLDELREGYKKQDDNSYDEKFKRICKVPLLLLDDLGAESTTPWVQEKLEMIVDYRYMNKLSLIVTTNKSIDELSPRLGSRLVRHPNAQLITILASEYTMRKIKK